MPLWSLDFRLFDFHSIPSSAVLNLCGTRVSLLNFLHRTGFFPEGPLGDGREDMSKVLAGLAVALSPSIMLNGGATAIYPSTKFCDVRLLAIANKGHRHNSPWRPEQLKNLVSAIPHNADTYFIICADAKEAILPWATAIARCLHLYTRKTNRVSAKNSSCYKATVHVFLGYVSTMMGVVPQRLIASRA
eukprot:GHVU01209263.1.p1 GENE.GHVU01209263.1~~GHVU01209263.1.p1  ORF type:complete len:189 (+),score=8.04 GHVU01209263.1:140-706(+)